MDAFSGPTIDFYDVDR